MRAAGREATLQPDVPSTGWSCATPVLFGPELHLCAGLRCLTHTTPSGSATRTHIQLCCLKPAWGVFVCRHELTPEGLKYLLQPTPEQVWLLLRQYIQVAEQTSGALARLGFGWGACLTCSAGACAQLCCCSFWCPATRATQAAALRWLVG